MVSDAAFERLVDAASRAPSADNMQAWSFARIGDTVEVRLEPERVLPTDVNQMFAWIGLGAAVENLTIAASREGFTPTVDYGALQEGPRPGQGSGYGDGLAVTVRLSRGGAPDRLGEWIGSRETNRGRYDSTPLDRDVLDGLDRSVGDLAVGVHWISDQHSLDLMARMDAHSTYIRLEHRPLHDELFGILRFSRRDIEEKRFGLEFEGIGVPRALAWPARQLRHPAVMKVVGRLGIGRAVARHLAARLRSAGAVCLVTAREHGPAGYVEAGRAMERLWLEATARGLAVQPHGVLPQYLTTLAVEPDGFAEVMRRHRAPFEALFPCSPDERPAIVLRVGRPRTRPARASVRLPVDELIATSPGLASATPAGTTHGRRGSC